MEYISIPLNEAIKKAQHRPAAYVLSSERDDNLYKGSCRNLAQRLKDHKAGRVSRTKNRRPLRLYYYEYCETFTQARQRENFLKSGKGREWLKGKRN